MLHRAEELLGEGAVPGSRFPLLLKFIDAAQELSVQVHPCDERAAARHPGQLGKTEAWVILDSNPQTSWLYAGFRDGSSPEQFRAALQNGTAPHHLHRFAPKSGDCVFLPAGTVHAIGADLLLFEVQQTSDLTYRLYDWDRIDPKTGRGRELHVEDALACAHFGGPVRLSSPSPNGRMGHEHLVQCPYFTLERTIATRPVTLGTTNEHRAIVILSGQGELAGEAIAPGDVILLPACIGTAELTPHGAPVTVLECRATRRTE
jgi:mannose-6-phosphate isomerase